MRTCKRCGIEKSFSEFYRNKKRPDGTSFYCKVCTNAYEEVRKLRDPEGFRVAERVRRHKSLLRNKYGITPAEYEEMLAAQAGKCAICQKPETAVGHKYGGTHYLAVDHCHRTGRVRALLCFLCNTVLGLMGEDPATLRTAAAYLETHAEPILGVGMNEG